MYIIHSWHHERLIVVESNLTKEETTVGRTALSITNYKNKLGKHRWPSYVDLVRYSGTELCPMLHTLSVLTVLNSSIGIPSLNLRVQNLQKSVRRDSPRPYKRRPNRQPLEVSYSKIQNKIAVE